MSAAKKDERIAELIKAAHDMFKSMKNAKQMDNSLKHADIFILNIIRKSVGQEGITPTQISKFLGISPSAITQVINSLEKREMVARRMSQTDRRSILIEITPKGIEQLDNINNSMYESFEVLIQRLGDEDTEQLLSLLKKSAEILKNL